jgi:hypothetical protein
MKSTRLTKQGLPDLNYYGPRRVPVAPVAPEPAKSEGAEIVAVAEVKEAVVAPTPAAA